MYIITLLLCMSHVICNNVTNNFLALVSFRFGTLKGDFNGNRNYYLPHLRSISTFKNTTFIYFTDTIDTSLPYPVNVYQIKVTWEDLVGRLETYVNYTFSNLKSSTHYYKVCDFRPVITMLYSEYFENYHWFGWIDNDLWFSSELEKFVIDYSMKGYVQVTLTEDDRHLSWGPISIFNLTFYRKYVDPELQSERNRQVMINVFTETIGVGFDEWGKNQIIFENSFSRILLDIYVKNKTLKHVRASEINAPVGLDWDGVCLKHSHWKEACGSCLLMIKNGDSLLYESIVHSQIVSNAPYKGWFICNFQFSKSPNLKKEVEEAYYESYENYIHSLNISDVLNADMIESSWHQGWKLTKFNNTKISSNYAVTIIVLGSEKRLNYKNCAFKHLITDSRIIVEYYDESNLPPCIVNNKTEPRNLINNVEKENCDKQQLILALQKSLRNVNKVPDFMLIIEDDSFVNVNNLINFVNKLKPEVGLYLGQKLREININIMTIGIAGGVLISNYVLRKLEENISECLKIAESEELSNYHASVIFTACIHKISGIEPTHSRLMRQFLSRPEECQHDYIVCHGFHNDSLIEQIYSIYDGFQTIH